MSVTVELLRKTPHGNMWDIVVVDDDDFRAYWPEMMKKVSSKHSGQAEDNTDKAMTDVKNTAVKPKTK